MRIDQNLSMKQALFLWIQQQTGLHVTAANEDQALHTLKILASNSGEDQINYAASLIDGNRNPQPFIDAVTTHESYFLRHRKQMELAIEHQIKPLLNKGIRPRVLSAPCAQGEEPYSFAMLLQDHGILPREVQITAVDIAASSIQQAKQGRYQPFSLRKAPESFIQNHFTEQNQEYAIPLPIQQSVQFQRMNLLTDALGRLPSGFHIIFCNNLLIYFDTTTRNQLLKIFQQLLDPNGMLFFDPTEVPHVITTLESRIFNNITVFGAQSRRNPVAFTAVESQTSHHLQPTKSPRPTPNRRGEAHASASTAAKDPSPLSSDSEKRRAAEAAHRRGAHREAARLYAQLIADYPLLSSWARIGSAKLLFESGKEMEALEEVELALSSDEKAVRSQLTFPDKADAHALIAQILKSKGMDDQIEKHLKLIRLYQPQHPLLKQ